MNLLTLRRPSPEPAAVVGRRARWSARNLTAARALGLVGIAGLLATGGLRDAIRHTPAADAAPREYPAGGHAAVIAQAVVTLDDGSLAWTVTQLEAGARASAVAGNGDPGFLLGLDGPALVRDGDGIRARLDGGEALAVSPTDDLTVRAAGPDSARLTLLTLGPAGGPGTGAVGGPALGFPSPGGSRDIDFVRDVLAEDEEAPVVPGAAPTFVLVTDGAIELKTDDGETRLTAGETAVVPTEAVATGAADEPSSFVAVVVGADVGEGAEAASATPTPRTRPNTNPSPRPTTPAPSPTPSPSQTPTPSPSPSPSPSPTPAGNGPTDDPDQDGLVNKDEDTVGTDRHDPDTDDDLLSDYAEILQFGTDPRYYDTDGDGWGDGDEVYQLGTIPTDPDSDDDGLNEGEEMFLGTNPIFSDTDIDGYTDGAEVYEYRTSPLDPDSHP
jgi:hypothetical protein